jgi:hypothetical protein
MRDNTMHGRTVRALNVDSTGRSDALDAALAGREIGRRPLYGRSMSPSVVLDPTPVRLEAGTSARIPLQIRNTGHIVEGYRVDVVGPPAAWTTVEPAEVTLYPGDTATLSVDLHPPRSPEAPAGEHLYGVRVVPVEHPEEAVVPEAVVEVLPFLELTAELVPRTSHGRLGGRHEVAVDNRGNAPVEVTLTASDPADSLLARVRPETLTVEAGHAGFADVRVRSARTVWRGSAVTHPFTVLVAPPAGNPVTLDGSHVQLPLIPSWLPKVALASLVALLALAALWNWPVKGTINSTAEAAVAPQVAAVKAQARQAGDAAQSAKGSAVDAGKSAKKAGDLVGTPPPPRSVELPFSERLSAATAKGAQQTARFTVPRGATVALTDFVFENPQGDFGTLQLALGNTTLFNMALENFRTSDFHFVSPIRAVQGDTITMTVQCNEVGQPPARTTAPTSCSTAAYLGGKVTRLTPARAR